MYKTDSETTRTLCEKIQWNYGMKAVKTMKRGGKTYVRGTLLKPQEARELEMFCTQNGYEYRGPFAD